MATERRTRIASAFLLDSMQTIAFVIAAATVNLGDVGTKHADIIGILRHFLETCRFTLVFVGRGKHEW